MNNLGRRVKRLEGASAARECRCGRKRYSAMPPAPETCPQCGGSILSVVVVRTDGFILGRLDRGEFIHYVGLPYDAI